MVIYICYDIMGWVWVWVGFGLGYIRGVHRITKGISYTGRGIPM